MKRSSRVIQQSVFALIAVLFFASVDAASPAANRRPDAATIEKATQATGDWSEEEGVFKVSVPRTDLAVTAASVRVTPALGDDLPAFQGAGDQDMVMGDPVLTEGGRAGHGYGAGEQARGDGPSNHFL
jgi:hypothetical protein